MVPFFAEALYRNLEASVVPGAPQSVHLTDWPVADQTLVDQALLEATRLTIRVVGLGRAARNAGKLKVRQPLAAAMIRTRRPEEWEKLRPFLEQIKEELNVKEVTYLADETAVAQYQLRPNLPALGPRLGPDLPKLVVALKALDAGDSVARLKRGERLAVRVGDRELSLGMDDVQPLATALPGYAVAEEHGYLVGLVSDLTAELQEEGLAREVVHRLQTLRKSAGFEVADRIVVSYEAGDRLRHVLALWDAYIRAETLALELHAGMEGADGFQDGTPLEGEPVTFVLRKA